MLAKPLLYAAYKFLGLFLFPSLSSHVVEKVINFLALKLFIFSKMIFPNKILDLTNLFISLKECFSFLSLGLEIGTQMSLC